MHLLLTDLLSCPKCGPESGLILLAERVEARRVYSGKLGCPACHSQYEVRGGVADLKVEDASNPPRDVAIEVDKLAALLGVSEGPAMLLLVGVHEAEAEALADMLQEVEVLVAHDDVKPGVERMGVSRLRVGTMMPLHDRAMRGVAISDGSTLSVVMEAARVCGIAARLVVQDASNEVRAWLGANGLRILAEQGQILVAVRHA